MIGMKRTAVRGRESSPPPAIMLEAEGLKRLGEDAAGRPWFVSAAVPNAELEWTWDRPIPDSGPARLSDGSVYVSVPLGEELGWHRLERRPLGTFASGRGSRAPRSNVKPPRQRGEHLVVGVRLEGDDLAALIALAQREGSDLPTQAKRLIVDGLARSADSPEAAA